MVELKSYSVLSCFSGLAGLCKLGIHCAGLSNRFQVTQFVEKSTYCQQVLRRHFPHIPIHDDICTFNAELGSFDVVVGGFPCTDISIAGKQAGLKKGTRSGLFFELMRVVRQVQPQFVLLENVPALLSGRNGDQELTSQCICGWSKPKGVDDEHKRTNAIRRTKRQLVCPSCSRKLGNSTTRSVCWMGIVLQEFSSIGFNAQWSTVSCASVGGVHKRERVFIIAYPSCTGTRLEKFRTYRQARKPINASQPAMVRQVNWAAVAEGADSGTKLSADSNCLRCNNGSNFWAERYAQAHQERHLATIHSNGEQFEFGSGALRANATNPQSPSTEAKLGAVEQFDSSTNRKPKTFTPVRGENNGLSRRMDSIKGLDFDLMHHNELPDWLFLATDTNIIPDRKERLQALGNAVVPQVAAVAWNRIAHLAFNPLNPNCT